MAKKKVSNRSKKPVKKTKKAGKKEPTLAQRLKKALTPEQRDRLRTALSKPEAPKPPAYDSRSQSSGTLADPLYDSWRSPPYTGGINDRTW